MLEWQRNPNNKYIIEGRNKRVDERGVDEDAIYRDAWRIADPGASNPVAVAGTLAQASSALLHHIGTDGVRKHPALKVMAGQLSFLYGVDRLGPDIEDLDAVKAYVDSKDKRDEILRVRDEQGIEAAQQKTVQTIRDMLL